MRVTLDTNVLVRAVVQDEPGQAAAASKLLREAELIAVPTSCLCEFVWVLRRTYRLPPALIAGALRNLLASVNVVTDRAAAEAGLWFNDQGGDFADGVIEFEGRHLGAAFFASFDRGAVRLLERAGLSAMVPSS
ncbi:MAG: type II toxin-antitoxin system VapC family toxin [Rhizobiaceae bacterium]